jgi:sugar lactone lactonase YvrE
VAGGNGKGDGVNQLNGPYGLYVDGDQTIYIADCSNHRIVEWKNGATSGRVVAGGNGEGNRTDQLNVPTDVILDKKNNTLIICEYNNKRVVRWPRQNGTNGEIIISDVRCYELAMDGDGYLYVSDYDKHEVRRWKIGERNGTVVAGGNGQGNRLDQLYGPRYVFVDQDHAVYVSDSNNHRVVKWTKGAKEGIVVAGGQGRGNGVTQISTPFGVFVDQLGAIYVTDHGNHRVMRWTKGTTQGSVVVGGNGGGGQANQLYYPIGLSFDRQNNLYVVDYFNHRVQKFHIDSNSNVLATDI